MIKPVSSADAANGERFERIGIAADARAAARTREQFARWLDRFFEFDPIRASDVVLATNEALANAAEFAYLLSDRPGTMDIQARDDAAGARLTVTVSDSGLWRFPTPGTRSRGRGIPLMKTLSDHATIETSAAGTQVCMEWTGVHPAVVHRPG
jgi:serine/threonine-protein kinase RsbW